jgi:hypothetical protein
MPVMFYNDISQKIKKFSCVDLIRKVVPNIGGKGSGDRPDLA